MQTFAVHMHVDKARGWIDPLTLACVGPQSVKSCDIQGFRMIKIQDFFISASKTNRTDSQRWKMHQSMEGGDSA